MDNSFYKSIIDYIAKNEGFAAKPYIDRGGRKAVGYGFNDTPERRERIKLLGHNPDDIWGNKGIDEQLAKKFLGTEVFRNEIALKKRFPFYANLPVPVKVALHDHVYNMGINVKFPKMEAALAKGDYNTAAYEMGAISPKNPAGVRERALRRAELIKQYIARQQAKTVATTKN